MFILSVCYGEYFALSYTRAFRIECIYYAILLFCQVSSKKDLRGEREEKTT